MKETFERELRSLFIFRWQPGKDLLIVLLSWFLVVASLYTATVIVGSSTGGGLPYFFLYAFLTATVFGIGIPVGWMVVIRKRPLSDLGITRERLGISLILQMLFALIVIPAGLRDKSIPVMEHLLPLISLALAIGLFEAIFWRGWMVLRLEEAFGFIPAALIGSVLYALYHIGYAMPLSEMIFLFFIGLMYAVAFRFTRSIFILWPIFQPAGQLITLLEEGLPLPVIAALGFFEVMLLMWVLIWLIKKYSQKRLHTSVKPA